MKKEFVYGLIVGIIISFLLITITEYFYFGSRKSGLSSIAIKNKYCSAWISKNCDISTDSILIYDFDADLDGALDSGEKIGDCKSNENEANDNFFMFCKCLLGCKDENCCKEICDCP